MSRIYGHRRNGSIGFCEKVAACSEAPPLAAVRRHAPPEAANFVFDDFPRASVSRGRLHGGKQVS